MGRVERAMKDMTGCPKRSKHSHYIFCLLYVYKECCSGEIEATRAGFRSWNVSLLKHEDTWTLRAGGLLVGTAHVDQFPRFTANAAAYDYNCFFELKVTSLTNLGDC